MGGWTVRNLPSSPELARSSGGRAHRETPLAATGFVHRNADGSINMALVQGPGASGESNPRLARMVLTPGDARVWAAALLAVAEAPLPA
jgi:hypothetical protein